jgi:glycosyltransferase involved in cell wall biosynthesis
MKILVTYNRYRHRVHGEEAVINDTERSLRAAGVEVLNFTRSAEGLPGSPMAQVTAGFAGIYNPRARKQFSEMLRRERPDVVHAHNLYPLISPSVLLAARDFGVPVVMTVHHYGLTCPVLTHFREGAACDSCVGSGEWQCVRNNCRDSLIQSVAYAIRSGIARRKRWFIDNVSVFVALSNFAKHQLQQSGFAPERIVVRPNCVRLSEEASAIDEAGAYIAYVGRLTYEKGVDLLCAAAVATRLPVRIAGDVTKWPDLAARYSDNVTFCGVLRGEQLQKFYREARFIVVPSRWWEVCPIVVLEAMNYGCPVLASDSGGLPEMLDLGRAGLLFTSGSEQDLARAMNLLWHDMPLRARLSLAARQRVAAEYDEKNYLQDILGIYRRAMAA